MNDKMSKCYTDYTLINSQPSIQAFKNLVNEMLNLYDSTQDVDDLFYYGVFMKPQNYAHYKFDPSIEYGFDIPGILISDIVKEKEKIDYVKRIISEIMKKQIEKPEWMKYIELNMVCNEFQQSPSTFLLIEAKTPKYEKMAQYLSEFVYSPNLTITMLKA